MTDLEFFQIEARLDGMQSSKAQTNPIIRDFKSVVGAHRKALVKLEKVQNWLNLLEKGQSTETEAIHQIQGIMKGII